MKKNAAKYAKNDVRMNCFRNQLRSAFDIQMSLNYKFISFIAFHWLFIA